MQEHNAGHNFSTKSDTNWKLIYYKAHLTFDDAKRRENYFKTSAGRRSLNRMLSSYNLTHSSFGAQSSTVGKK
jgi:predicted GIY-YIG superfamily endonuclease